MNILQRLLMAVALTAGMAMSVPALAAGNDLPDIGNTAKANAERAEAGRKQDEQCTRCHNENEVVSPLTIYQTKHGVRADGRAPTCQGCHGASEKHMKGDPNVKGRAAPDVQFKKKGEYPVSDESTRTGQCISCHKGGARTNWDGGKHQTSGVACNDCHKVHQPPDKLLSKKTQTEVCFTCHQDQRADSKKISHHPIAEGKVVCSDCHNPHGSTGPKLMKKNTVTETCFQCHAEKRGPFLFEHQPVTEDCSVCHTPHGSNITPLLKSRAPFLCQECHDGTHASGTPAGPNAAGYQGGLANKNLSGLAQYPSKNLVGRSCMNCHSQVHGSNSPAGGYLQR